MASPNPIANKETKPLKSTVDKGFTNTKSKKDTDTLPKLGETEVERELKELRDDKEVLGLVMGEYDRIKGDRYRIDWKFKVAEQFYRGDIYARYNKHTREVETPVKKRGEWRIELPVIGTLVDANVTALTKEKPQWDVLPESWDEEGVKEASRNNMLLDWAFDTGNLAEKITQVARSGIKKSIGILEAGWDPDKKKMHYEVVRPEDFYVNSKSNTFEDAICVIKIISKDIALIRNSSLYKAKKSLWQHELKADIDVTESDGLKEVMDRDTGNSTDSSQSRGSVLLAECYYKYYKSGETKPSYRIVTFPVKQRMLLRNEEVEFGMMPWFFPFHSDKHDGEIYGQGKVLPVASLVQSIADLVNRTVRHHQIFSNGAFVVDKGANPVVVDGEAGKLIYKQPGRGLTPLQIPPLPPTVFQQVDQLMNFVMDSMAVHETSLGRPPKGVDSARGLESLTFGDNESKTTLKQNFERFMAAVGRYSLLCMAMNMDEAQIIRIYNEDGEMEKFAARGSETFENPEEAEMYNAYEDTLLIKPKDDIKVVVTSGLGNTPDAQYAKAQEMRETGLVDRKFVLRAARVPGNISKISEQAYKESMEAERARKEPPPKDTKDYINTAFKDLSKDEQSNYLMRIGMQPGKLPRPGQPDFEMDMQDAKLASQAQQLQLQAQMQDQSVLTQKEAEIQTQEQQSMNPLIPGGFLDATLTGEENDPGQI